MNDILKNPGGDFPLNILLVEDNEADVKIALRAFEKARLPNNLFVVNNGQACLDFVSHQGDYLDRTKFPSPDLILMDISMPVLDGFGALKALKEQDDTKSIPVIILTGSNNEDDIRKSYRGGANSFIRKPVAYEEFAGMIDHFNIYWHQLNILPGKKDRS